jgi:hypothetical protein
VSQKSLVIKLLTISLGLISVAWASRGLAYDPTILGNRHQIAFQQERAIYYKIFHKLIESQSEEFIKTYVDLGYQYSFNAVLNNSYQSASEKIALKALVKKLVVLRNAELDKARPFEYVLLNYAQHFILNGTFPSGLIQLAENFDALTNMIDILSSANTREASDALFQLEVKMKTIALASIADLNRALSRADGKVFSPGDWWELAYEASEQRSKIDKYLDNSRFKSPGVTLMLSCEALMSAAFSRRSKPVYTATQKAELRIRNR